MRFALSSWSLRALVAGAMLACGGGGGGYGGITNPPPPPPPTNPPGTPAPTPTASVTLGAASFDPASVSITRNGTVTWNNTSGVTHNVTFGSQSGAPSSIGDHMSGSNQRSFFTAGTFNYSCTLHGGMNGTVTVQ